MSKKSSRKRALQAPGERSGRKPAARTVQPAASRGRKGRQSLTTGFQWPIWSAACLAAAIVVVSATGFDDRLFAPFFVARLAPFYPLTIAFAALGVLVIRIGRTKVAIDLIDVLGASMVAWLALGALVSPSPAVAWMGYYNRGSGALFWIALIVLSSGARRLLAGERQTRVLVVAVAGTLRGWHSSRLCSPAA